MEYWLDGLAQHPEWFKMILLGVSTLGSEDLTTISAGVLASKGVLHPATAILGCFLGIFIGDGLLYVVGLVLGQKAIRLPLLRRMLTEDDLARGTRWFQRHGISTVMVCRFIPGTRLPTYFAAGVLGADIATFLLASAVATAIWTPLVVYGSWFFGNRFQAMFQSYHHFQWLGTILVIFFMFLLLRGLLKMGNWKFRRRLRSRLTRITHWEFWPVTIFYLPVFLYNFWLALKYRRLSLPLLSNPGIEYSGYIGESKTNILSSFRDHHEFIARFLRLSTDETSQDAIRRIEQWMQRESLEFPIILKPDIGQRGTGVKKARDKTDLEQYLANSRFAIQVQEYVPGPYEFGIFYLRLPNQDQGRILGLTGKEFPFVVGDGEHNLEELILRLPTGLGRYHIYRKRFKARLKEILPPGTSLPLVKAGNHCLGTIFKDSSYLITAALSEKFDQISKSIPGFFIGRYDIRAQNLEEFRTASNFKIIELNGASSEPGHIYDARHTLIYAYRTLFQQYRHLWEIGSQNARGGMTTTPLWALVKEFLKYRKLAKSYPKPE